MHDGSTFLTATWLSASTLVRGSLLVLLSMFLWVCMENVERIEIFLAAARQSRDFASRSKHAFADGDYSAVLELAASRNRSHLAAIFVGGLRGYFSGRKSISVDQSLTVAERAARIEANRAHEKFRQGMDILGTIATTAPFVGFFGTVIGILDSFRGYAYPHDMVIAMTASYVAYALVCTAGGIFVAVPAVWCFNWRRAQLLTFDAEMQAALLKLHIFLRTQRP